MKSIKHNAALAIIDAAKRFSLGKVYQETGIESLQSRVSPTKLSKI